MFIKFAVLKIGALQTFAWNIFSFWKGLQTHWILDWHLENSKCEQCLIMWLCEVDHRPEIFFNRTLGFHHLFTSLIFAWSVYRLNVCYSSAWVAVSWTLCGSGSGCGRLENLSVTNPLISSVIHSFNCLQHCSSYSISWVSRLSTKFLSTSLFD